MYSLLLLALIGMSYSSCCFNVEAKADTTKTT